MLTVTSDEEPSESRTLRAARYRILLSEDYSDLWQTFETWKKDTKYLILKNEETRQYLRMKCAKRGNDVYENFLERRLSVVRFKLKDYFPSRGLFNPRARGQGTRMLFLTLTYDTNKGESLKEAWETVSERYNRYLSRLRKRFHDMWVFRAFEATKQGYPHVHFIAFFPYHMFRVFKYRGKFRVREKAAFDCWENGYVDVQGMFNPIGAFKEVSKYLMKSSTTQAWQWLFRKRSYAISGADLIHGTMRNSNPFMERSDLGEGFVDLTGTVYTFIGIVSGGLFEDSQIRVASLTEREVDLVFKNLAPSKRFRDRVSWGEEML